MSEDAYTKPTPGPWSVSYTESFAEIVGPPHPIMREAIATVDRASATDDANAAHIVRCVNAHPALVAWVLAADEQRRVGILRMSDERLDEIDRLRAAALLSAKGENQ